MSKPINPDLDSFPDFNPKPTEADDSIVPHSGNLGLEFPAQAQAGPLREQILSTPEDATALDTSAANGAEEVTHTDSVDALSGTPPVTIAPITPATVPQDPEKRHWSTRTKVIAAGATVLAIGGAAFGIGKATSGDNAGVAPTKPAATSEPFPPQSASKPSSSVDLDTGTASMQQSVSETTSSPEQTATTQAPSKEASPYASLTIEKLTSMSIDDFNALPRGIRVAYASAMGGSNDMEQWNDATADNSDVEAQATEALVTQQQTLLTYVGIENKLLAEKGLSGAFYYTDDSRVSGGYKYYKEFIESNGNFLWGDSYELIKARKAEQGKDLDGNPITYMDITYYDVSQGQKTVYTGRFVLTPVTNLADTKTTGNRWTLMFDDKGDTVPAAWN